jgi:catechol 2,3-dioxygenase-like lactoylglutathione lyase family enzyme
MQAINSARGGSVPTPEGASGRQNRVIPVVCERMHMPETPQIGAWPAELPAVQVRMARPTAQLDRIVEFYRDVLRLPQLHESADDEWSVVMFGLPGDQYNIEFVAHRDGIDGTAPTRENLLVFYFDSPAQQQAVADRCRRAAAEEVELDNPWWRRNGAVAFLDPDSWTIVLMPNPVPLMHGG